MSDNKQDWELRMKMIKQEKVTRYHEMNQHIMDGQLLFVGSSLMEQFPIESFIQDYGLPFHVYNRGIGGFIIPELDEALDACVLELKPRRMFINIGTNDLTNPEQTTDQVIAAYEQLLDKILASLPQLEIILMAYYPINIACAPNEGMKQALTIRNNERIHQANDLVKAMAERRGWVYIDVNDTLKDENGCLRAEFTYEGMHIKPEGYRTIMPSLLPYIIGPYKR